MSYIYTDLKTKLAAQIADPALDDSVMGDALNYTQQEIFGKFALTLNSAQQTNTVTVNTNTLASALPTDFQSISSLYVTAPVGLQHDLTEGYTTPKDFRSLYPLPSVYGAGPLTNWTLWTTIEFSRNANLTYTVVLDYIKTIPFMSTGSDIPTVPQSFEELLMIGAKIRIYEQKEDFDYAGQFTNRYGDLLEAFVTRYSSRQVDTQVVIPGARGRVQQ